MTKKVVIVPLLLITLTLLVYNSQRLRRYQAAENLNRMVNNPDIPVSLAITTFALGPFRALVFDALWWRAIQQQDRGEYFDALQLAEWITKLQPTYASVWAYLGWNMAYNIAYDFANEADRWEWIHRAIVLLRDEGLQYNPGNTVIRHELARIFYDRIGNNVDPAADYLKNQWAFKMMQYLDTGTRDELLRLQQAAATVDELRRRPNVMPYAQKLFEQGVDIFDFAKHPPKPGWMEVDLPQPIKESAGAELYDFYKRSRLEAELRLDVDRMVDVDREYGPLDWRLHQAHAIYWAAEEDFHKFMASGVNYTKIVRQSMMQAFYEGRLYHDPVRNVIIRTSNLEIIGKIHDFVEYLLDHEGGTAIDDVHRNFLESAVTILYTYNQDSAARELFEHYQEDYLHDNPMEYETFIQRSLEDTLIPAESIGAVTDRKAIIEVAIFQSLQWLEFGEDDRSNGYYNLAALLWRRHQQTFQNDPGKLLPPWESIVRSVKDRYARSRGIPENQFNARVDTARAKKPQAVDVGSLFGHERHDE